MQKRPLGQTGIDVATLAFGGNVFGWTADEATSFSLLDAFVAEGFNLIDTADVYTRWIAGHQGGESETVIGKWLKRSGNREKVVIATKVGMDMGPGGKGLSRDHIRQSVEGSLKRLQTDYIDLYQAHTDDESTPLEETLAAFGELVEQGKIRAFGASNYSAPRLLDSFNLVRDKELPAYQTLQPLYNLADRGAFEDALEELCMEEGLGVLPYYSLGAGFLTGKYRSDADLAKSPRGETVKKRYWTEHGRRVLAALDEVSARVHATPGQVAIAWLLRRPAVTAPIASATSLPQLHDLVAATRLTLSDADVTVLNEASRQAPA
ncbi:MAG TPA: aldo/keto reductase [Pirellulales bacterium]